MDNSLRAVESNKKVGEDGEKVQKRKNLTLLASLRIRANET